MNKMNKMTRDSDNIFLFIITIMTTFIVLYIYILKKETHHLLRNKAINMDKEIKFHFPKNTKTLSIWFQIDKNSETSGILIGNRSVESGDFFNLEIDKDIFSASNLNLIRSDGINIFKHTFSILTKSHIYNLILTLDNDIIHCYINGKDVYNSTYLPFPHKNNKKFQTGKDNEDNDFFDGKISSL